MDTCPNCGAAVPPKSKSCPGCGADEKTGWSATVYADHLGLPDEAFDYEAFVKEEFGGQTKPRSVHWFWWLTALLLVVLFLFFWFR
jgi:hypothetical protein